MQGYRYDHGDQPLEGYTIQYALGRGGFGEVYFAVSDSGREVALKAIQNYEEIELRGIGHCMNLKSSHLVTIFDVKNNIADRPWVIMEYVSGPSLAELLDGATDSTGKRIGIGRDQAMYFTRELIKGLRYLHDAGVVHRDLKPHNIFFEDGTVKIGDYSLSKAISTSHRSSHTTTVGSVHYMAPEIGEGNYGKAVDIYALGVILFEMLVGAPPYVGESMGEVLIKHLTSQPDVSSIGEPFASTISKAMERKPADRFQSVDEMLVALCPQDHSSYLPAPASLSMIGDSAQRARAKQNVSRQSNSVQAPPKAIAAEKDIETSKAYKALAETRAQTDSHPFERPGFAMPWGAGDLWQVFGLKWKRSATPVQGTDQTSLVSRGVLAIAASTGFVTLMGVLLPISNLTLVSMLLLILLVPLTGAFICLAFLQTLPRSDALSWSASVRLIALVIIAPVAILAMAVMDELGLQESNDVFVPVFAVLSLLVDWRSYLAADRYPRVGILKTLAAVGILIVVSTFLGGRDAGAIAAAILGAAVIVTIQILAPHVQAQKTKRKTSAPEIGSVIDVDDQIDGLAETRNQTASLLLKEKI